MTQDQRGLDPEPDILAELCERLRQQLPQLPAEVLLRAEAQLRQEYGGQRTRIAKRRKFLTQQQRQALVQEAIHTPASDAEIMERHKVSRATLYRHMKRGI